MQLQTFYAALSALGACLTLAQQVNIEAPSNYQLTADRQADRGRLIALRAPHIPDLIESVGEANQFFISQYRSGFNARASTANANCGPACLAMALRRFGFTEARMYGDPEHLIAVARIAMTGNANQSGNTDNDDVVRGAAAFGMRAVRAPNLNEIDAALAQGALAVVSGSPSVAGSFAQRLNYKHCRNGHFIVVAGKNGDSYLMCDPESPNGTVEISRSELAAFISYYRPGNRQLRGAIALYG